MKTNYNTGAALLYKAIKKIETERKTYKKVLRQIAAQPRGSLSRRLAQSVLDFIDTLLLDDK